MNEEMKGRVMKRSKSILDKASNKLQKSEYFMVEWFCGTMSALWDI